MFRLTIATLFALLLPVLWVIGAKAQTGTTGSSRPGGPSASRYQGNPYGLSDQQRQTQQVRDDISARLGQMYDSLRMVSSSDPHYETIRGLVSASEGISASARQSTDFYSTENFRQQMATLQAAVQVLMRLR